MDFGPQVKGGEHISKKDPVLKRALVNFNTGSFFFPTQKGPFGERTPPKNRTQQDKGWNLVRSQSER